MAYVANFRDVQVMLSNRGARLLKRTPVGDVYLDGFGQYIKVARNGSGWQIDVYGSLAACGCDG